MSDEESRFDANIESVWKMKSKMQSRGIHKAKIKHPGTWCSGDWHASLVPKGGRENKKAIWIYCDNPDCGFRFME